MLYKVLASLSSFARYGFYSHNVLVIMNPMSSMLFFKLTYFRTVFNQFSSFFYLVLFVEFLYFGRYIVHNISTLPHVFLIRYKRILLVLRHITYHTVDMVVLGDGYWVPVQG